VETEVSSRRKREAAIAWRYPDVSLKAARERREDLRRQLASGIDPSVKRKTEKAAGEDSFEAVAREWFAKFSATWAKNHADKILRRLEKDLFPWLGSRPTGKLRRLSFSPPCGGSSHAALSRPLTEHTRTADKSFVTPLRPAARNATPPPICVARCRL
jgi:hypothetical protein